MKKFTFPVICAALVFVAIIIAIISYIIMLLWNFAAVSAFGLPELTFYEAFALFVMVKIIIMPASFPASFPRGKQGEIKCKDLSARK